MICPLLSMFSRTPSVCLGPACMLFVPGQRLRDADSLFKPTQEPDRPAGWCGLAVPSEVAKTQHWGPWEPVPSIVPTDKPQPPILYPPWQGDELDAASAPDPAPDPAPEESWKVALTHRDNQDRSGFAFAPVNAPIGVKDEAEAILQSGADGLTAQLAAERAALTLPTTPAAVLVEWANLIGDAGGELTGGIQLVRDATGAPDVRPTSEPTTEEDGAVIWDCRSEADVELLIDVIARLWPTTQKPIVRVIAYNHHYGEATETLREVDRTIDLARGD